MVYVCIDLVSIRFETLTLEQHHYIDLTLLALMPVIKAALNGHSDTPNTDIQIKIECKS